MTEEFLLPTKAKSKSKLILSTDGVLGGIPFEALSINNQLLLNSYNISYANSLKSYEVQQSLDYEKEFWVGFAPNYSNNNLPNNLNEIVNIAQRLQGKVYENEDASIENFFKSVQKNTSIAHLAMHGKIDNFNPMNSYIQFYEDEENQGKLNLGEVFFKDIQLNSLVLSACESGIGKFNYGDGGLSMAKSFEMAGVANVVMTLWKVPDKETARLMDYFYIHLEQGETVPIALQQAKQDYLLNTTDPILRHPYYWAGFVSNGNNEIVLHKTSLTSNTLVVLICIFGILVLLFFVYRNRIHYSRK